MGKFASRKFLICLAAFLGSIGASIAALHTENEKVAIVGIVCAIISAAIYAAVEAYVDGKAVNQFEERVFNLDDLTDEELMEYDDIEDEDDAEEQEL